MSREAQSRMDRLLDEAERSGCCCAPANRTDGRLFRRMCSKGRLISPISGLYARSEYWQGLSRSARARHLIASLARLHPDWVFCGPSAALLWGLSLSYSDLEQVHIMGTAGARLRKGGTIRLHAGQPEQIVLKEGIRICSVEETVIACLRAMDLRRGLAVADSALRTGLMTKKQLVEGVESRAQRGVRGIKQARLTASLADGRAESGGESIARAVMYEHGFSMPDLQVEIEDPMEAGRRYRSDFLWMLADGSLVAGELDGRAKYSDPSLTEGRSAVDILADERLRESRIAAAGIRTMRFSFRDVMTEKPLVKLMVAFGIPRRGRRS